MPENKVSDCDLLKPLLKIFIYTFPHNFGKGQGIVIAKDLKEADYLIHTFDPFCKKEMYIGEIPVTIKEINIEDAGIHPMGYLF